LFGFCVEIGEPSLEIAGIGAKFEQADNGERRTTQALQLDTAEQTAEQFLEPL
jgi:hypothetical protein